MMMMMMMIGQLLVLRYLTINMIIIITIMTVVLNNHAYDDEDDNSDDDDDDDLKIIQCTQPFLQSFTSVRRWKPLDDTFTLQGYYGDSPFFIFFCCSIFDKQMDPYETFR